MCLIFIAYRACRDTPLVVAANRDEYHHRATRAAQFWHDVPEILAGRDLKAGGTWMGVSRNGRFAAITNYRDSRPAIADAPSRGLLVSDFLRGREPALAFLERLARDGSRYNGFSLLVYAGESLAFYCNRGGEPRCLGRGVHGLSNRELNCPWPKVSSGRHEFKALLASGTPRLQALYSLLGDRRPAADGELPDTGVGLERERFLSPRFILGPEYGTRCSTLLSIDSQGHARFHERSYDVAGEPCAEVDFAFAIAGATESVGQPDSGRTA